MPRILIVEDDLALLFALRALFERHGCEVSESRTVAGAIVLLDPPPDWIILDLGLADGRGEDVLLQVRSAGIPTRVAIVSAMLDAERIAGLRPLRPDVLLGKPVSFERLLRACGIVPRPGTDTEKKDTGRPPGFAID